MFDTTAGRGTRAGEQRAAPPPLYDAEFEHDACGTGFVARVDGDPRHEVVEMGLRALGNLTHRGAVAADAASGDGAGVTIQLPVKLLLAWLEDVGIQAPPPGRLAVAMTFLPRVEDAGARARRILEDEARRIGFRVLAWRPVPNDPSALGRAAEASCPAIEQLLLTAPAGVPQDECERLLYLARRRAERGFREEELDAYVASMSGRVVVYKGLMLAEAVGAFYPDLLDPRTESALVIFHQRFATNTLPQWKLAQPFRRVAHNGEINTLLGNRNWMRSREPDLSSPVWGGDVADLTPVITPIGSDTASLDEVLDLLVASGRDILEAVAMLIPEAWENKPGMDRALRAFYQYHACLTEPWDGPASVAFTDGRIAAAVMDRNGLRPARYKATRDGLIVVGSEVGVLELPDEDVVAVGRIGPGEMLAVDTASGRLLHNDEIKGELASREPYERWVADGLTRISHEMSALPSVASEPDEGEDLALLHVLHGYSKEELTLVLEPMGTLGKEPVGSMGDDAQPSALGGDDRLLYTYFRQRFAQVTNPPIDSIRERIVMSLDTYLGRRGSILDTGAESAHLVHLASPVLREEELGVLRSGVLGGLVPATLPARFVAEDGAEGLSSALDALCAMADEAIDRGCDLLVISDREVDPELAPIPMLLAVATVHHHLIRGGRRMRASLVAEAGDARDVHQVATLIGYGASAVAPWLGLRTVREMAEAGEPADAPTADAGERAIATYVRALETGVLKIMSKMGISAVASYHGAQIFEALGVHRTLVERSFPGTPSRIGGIGVEEIAEDVVRRHHAAFGGKEVERGGWYKYRRNGDYHANEPPVWRALHAALQGGGTEEYRAFADLVHARPPTALRDLLEMKSDRAPIPLERVEAVESITPRFQTGAMSLGALSAEAHEDIARAMNRLGGRSNSGEGGEDPERYQPHGRLRAANSSVKQVASARFGVTAGYLAAASELEIKMAQGSKPGEGGQLPSGKVSSYIAKLRHVHPGTPLISPPPHHDIYSIEDLAQLIYDLKMVNPRAHVAVKLVATPGVGTIAAGVAKAYADVIHISGADGGTGASPLSSVKYAGLPWELGLAETQQTLVMNGLRGRVRLSTDGGFHTGRDVVKAALLGAERYGFGTAALIAIGCKMARQCHSNTCPVGIASQADELRAKYFGTPEMLIQYFTELAGEVREILAWLGYESLDEVIGRADLLSQIESVEAERWRGVDLSALIAEPVGTLLRSAQERNDRSDFPLDDRIMAQLGSVLEEGGTFKSTFAIRNTDRAVGGRIAGSIARTHGDAGLPNGSIDLTFRGSAGQSFGAWLVDGMRFELVGEANDYVAKGMGGGEISIRRPDEWVLAEPEPTLAGNTVLYGATGGSLFIAGRAGERFAVRNSGACAVVEGVGKHACEYMTRGVVVVLGATGRNFGAGMSGGCAFVYDPRGVFPGRLNPTLVSHEPVNDDSDVELLRALLQRHVERTGSERAREILGTWEVSQPLFWRVAPKESARAAAGSVVRPTRTLATVDPLAAPPSAPLAS